MMTVIKKNILGNFTKIHSLQAINLQKLQKLSTHSHI